LHRVARDAFLRRRVRSTVTMTSDPANSMRCAGVALLIFGILGGIVSPTGPLWAFIIGCMTVCCIEPGEAGMRKKAPCVRGLSIAGIVLSSLSLIGFIIFGAWLLSAGELACEITRGIYDCPWNRLRRLGQVDGPLLDAKHFTQEIASPGLGRVLSEGYCASGCPEEWKNDGWCDTGCNNAACNFDEGDCDGVPDYDASCPTDCATHMQGNGVCDYQCYSMQCNYDYGDCDSDPMLPDHCDPMHHAVDAVCGWVTGLGAFVIAYPGMLQIIYIIFFSIMVCRANELHNSSQSLDMSGVVMTSTTGTPSVEGVTVAVETPDATPFKTSPV